MSLAAILAMRHQARFEAMIADWYDEAAQAALDGNPKRAWYLAHMATRVAS